MIWPRVNKQSPCPVCGKVDWCCLGDFQVKCMRVESASPCQSGGWYHDYADGPKAPVARPIAPPAAPTVNCSAMIRAWIAGTMGHQLRSLSDSLKVSEAALRSLGACWSTMDNAWAFPMRDQWGEVVGIRLRSAMARKWSVTGGKQGLFYDADLIASARVAWLPEGPTSTAALITMGLFAVGRSSCNCSADQVKAYLKKIGVSRAVIVADRDKVDERTGKRPGIAGAMKLKKELGLKSVVWVPPAKDARQFLIDGGTAAEAENATRNMLWRNE